MATPINTEPDNKPRVQNLAKSYSLDEKEKVHALRYRSELTITKAGLAEIDNEIESIQHTLDQVKARRQSQLRLIEAVSSQVNGWSDAVAMVRGDDNPRGFAIDFSNNAQIVRMENANLG